MIHSSLCQIEGRCSRSKEQAARIASHGADYLFARVSEPHLNSVPERACWSNAFFTVRCSDVWVRFARDAKRPKIALLRQVSSHKIMCPSSHFVQKTVSQIVRIQFIVMHNARPRRREIKYGKDKMAMFSILQIKTI